MRTLKKTIAPLGLGLAALAALAPAPALAQEESPLSFNIGATTDYRFRGLAQTRFRPALQGGADYEAANGLYVGTWLSTIRWIEDAGKAAGVDTGNAKVEWDIYAGFKKEIVPDASYDVGVLAYIYPGNKFKDLGAKNTNTVEVYGALNFGPFTAKYSHAVTSLFGTGDATTSSKNSSYIDLSASFELGGGVVLAPHLGYQKVKNFGDYSYTDWSVTVSKDFEGFEVSAAVVGTNTRKFAGVPAYVSPDGKDLGRTGLVVSVKKSF